MNSASASGQERNRTKPPSYKVFILTAGVCVAIGIAVFGTMLLVNQRIPTNSQQGYFLVAFVLAIAAALILGGVLKSPAHSKGKLWGFNITFGAPATIFFGVMLAAYLFDHPDVLYTDVSLRRPDHTYISSGKILVHNEMGCRAEELIRGSSAFFRLPQNCRGIVTIDTDVEGFEPTNSSVPLKRTIELQMVPTQASCLLLARLLYTNDTPVSGATVWAGAWKTFAMTSKAGVFTLPVPRKCGTSVSLTIKLPTGKYAYKDEIPLNGEDGKVQEMVVK